jgi:hypothetical protein
MIGKNGARNLLESVGGDPRKFGHRFGHMLGICDSQGRKHRRRGSGDYELRAPEAGVERISTDEVSIRGLAEGLLGEEWEARLKKGVGLASLMEGLNLQEDNGAGAIMASAFADINAFTAATAGLLDAMILEAYQNPDFIGDVLAPPEPSKQFEGRKTIGVSRIGDQAEERLPGMPTKRIQVGERWLTQPRTVENALAAEITYEAIYLDLTGGQLSEHAGAAGVGEWLGYRKELRIIDSFIGGVNSYNYKGTNYSTYIASGYYNNYLSSGNELLHEDNVQTAMILFRDMLDPDISTRILIQPNTILVNREKLRVAESILGSTATAFQYRDNPQASAPQEINVSNPYYKGKFRILESPLVYQECVGSGPTQLGLSATAAGKAWWLFESGSKTHVYVQNWPMRTQSAAPNQVDMIDRGVVLFVKADERGVPFWKEPRRVVQSRA